MRNKTEIIPEIINEPIAAGCVGADETVGYLAGEVSRLRSIVNRTGAPKEPAGTRFPMTEKQISDLNRRFTYHPPNGSQPERYVAIREKAKELAFLIAMTSKESREQSTALTKVEEAVFWANAGIARNG